MSVLNRTGTHEVLERAYKASIRVPPDEQAAFVQTVLGSRLAAACLGLKDTRTLSSWSTGGPIRSQETEHRLQVLFRVTSAIDEAFGPAVAAAFVRGSNPVLGGQSPLIVLADTSPHDSEEHIVAAVEALLTA